MKKTAKVFTLILTAVMILALMPFTALADGSYSVDTTYMVLRLGQTGTITIEADNAAGRVDWSSTGAVSASGYAYLDNGMATIDVTADSVGTGYVTVSPTDIETYDDEPLGYSYTVQVDVVGEDGGYTDGNNPPAQDLPADPDAAAPEGENNEGQEPQQAIPSNVLTDGNTDYENLSDEDRMDTSVDGENLYIIRFPLWLDEEGREIWNDEVGNLDMLVGFDLARVNYKNVEVDCFRYKDMLQVFILKNPETNRSDYYILHNGEGFEKMAYVTVNGKQYIVVDFPDDFVVPEGYQIVEMTLGSNTVQALKKIPEANVPAASQTETAAPADETAAPADTQETPEDEAEADSLRIVPQQRTMVMLNGYTEEVSPGLDSADPTDDLYYIYCLVDGKTQLYSYDSGEGTLQRASITVYHEVPTEPQTVIVYEPARADDPQPQAQTQQDEGQDLKGIGWNGLQIQMKVLLIALAVAIILIIILIIAFIAAGSRKRKTGRSRKKKQQDIPPRSGRSSENEDDDAFFSYVKTEQGGIDFDDLN